MNTPTGYHTDHSAYQPCLMTLGVAVTSKKKLTKGKTSHFLFVIELKSHPFLELTWIVMEEETDLGGLDEESRLVLLTGREYTQPGSVVSNCILLIGSPEGECGKCTKPCLHPLATDDIKAYFQVLSYFLSFEPCRMLVFKILIGLMILHVLSSVRIPPLLMDYLRCILTKFCLSAWILSPLVQKRAD